MHNSNQTISGKLDYDIKIVDFEEKKNIAVVLRNKNGDMPTDLSKEEKMEIISDYIL